MALQILAQSEELKGVFYNIQARNREIENVKIRGLAFCMQLRRIEFSSSKALLVNLKDSLVDLKDLISANSLVHQLILEKIFEAEYCLIFILVNGELDPRRIIEDSRRQEPNIHIDSLISEVFYHLIKIKIFNGQETQILFSDFWENFRQLIDIAGLCPSSPLKKIVMILISDYNPIISEYQAMASAKKIRDLTGLLYSNIDDFIKIKEYTSIIGKFETECLGGSSLLSNLNYGKKMTIAVSGMPEEYKNNQTLNTNSAFEVGVFGMLTQPNQRSRIREMQNNVNNPYIDDGLLLLGKASRSRNFGCDIEFPFEDPRINDLNCIIFFCGVEYTLNQVPHYQTNPQPGNSYFNSLVGFHYIDCSTSGSTGLKLFPSEKILLKKGQMFRIANDIIIEIEDISQEEIGKIDNQIQYDTGKTVSFDESSQIPVINYIIKIKNHKGPFSGQTFSLQTRTRDLREMKTVFNVGAGGSGHEPDLFYPRDTGISRLHAIISLENGSWYIEDQGSTNLTILLAKNSQQYTGKIPSHPQPLFLPKLNNQVTETAVLVIENYKFFLRLVSQ